MATLGERLQANDDRYRASEEARRASEAQRHQDAVLHDERVIEAFYADAKKHFTEGILAGKSGAELAITVGDPDFDEETDPVDKDYQGIYKIMRREALAATKSPGAPSLPAAFNVYGKYKGAWEAFTAWAKGEGLSVSWRENYLNEDLTKSNFILYVGRSLDAWSTSAARAKG